MYSDYIAGDWGTTNLRLYLCHVDVNNELNILDSIVGPGIASVDDVEETLFRMINPWLATAPSLPIILSGMVGSNIGWRETDYHPCPLVLNEFFKSFYQFEVNGHSVTIVPGLSCINPLGEPDLMRGEETQVMGWASSELSINNENFLLCLPGTHTKWVSLEKGKVNSFMTGFSGELFNLLSEHSILLKNVSKGVDHAAFLHNLNTVNDLQRSHLLHHLFSVRSKQIKGSIESSEASAYLSALVIGADIEGALDIYKGQVKNKAKIIIIGEEKLSRLYQSALEFFGCSSIIRTASETCLAAYQQISAKQSLPLNNGENFEQ